MRDVVTSLVELMTLRVHFDRNAIEQLKSILIQVQHEFRRQRRSMLTQLRLSSSLGQGYLKNYRN